MRRAVSQSLPRAARVISAISRGISLDATEIIPTPPRAIRGRVTASSPANTAKCSGTALQTSAIWNISAGFLHPGDVREFGQPRQRSWFEVGSGTSGDVIED